jgi:hypothetical protein
MNNGGIWDTAGFGARIRLKWKASHGGHGGGLGLVGETSRDTAGLGAKIRPTGRPLNAER